MYIFGEKKRKTKAFYWNLWTWIPSYRLCVCVWTHACVCERNVPLWCLFWEPRTALQPCGSNSVRWASWTAVRAFSLFTTHLKLFGTTDEANKERTVRSHTWKDTHPCVWWVYAPLRFWEYNQWSCDLVIGINGHGLKIWKLTKQQPNHVCCTNRKVFFWNKMSNTEITKSGEHKTGKRTQEIWHREYQIGVSCLDSPWK